jgi:hypothetical protein
VEHKEVPKEEAAVKPVRALKRRLWGWNLGLGCCGQPKKRKRTQGSVGPRKKLAAAYRGMTRCAIPPRRQVQGQDSVARGAPKGRMFGKRHREKPKGITGIRNQGSRQEPRWQAGQHLAGSSGRLKSWRSQSK